MPRYRTSRPESTPRRRWRPDVALCYGTRPQVVKVARLLPALQQELSVFTVDTGQHYDDALRGALYRDLELAAPDAFLGVGPGHPMEQAARMSAATTLVLSRMRPRMVVVVGDTNSTLACALAASQLGIPVVHVEAGLRSGDPDMAEERNRCIVDHASALLCAPSLRAAATLAREGVTGQVVVTGDIARDVLEASVARLPTARAEAPFVLSTLHRAELTDAPERLQEVITALGQLALPVLLPLHPRTRAAIDTPAGPFPWPQNVTVTPPLDYTRMLSAIRDASVVVTDSGGVQREAYWLGTPCVTMRGITEWVETVELGANRLIAPSGVRSLPQAIDAARCAPRDWPRDTYGCGDAGLRIAAAISAMLPARRRASPLPVG
ncbi:MAG: UDP-N-acetyl glucosamine 2-epimerase [Gemmatimonadetes bacterium]|nr:UDP-N-acetyl glucosamine 2-epimerase [Gemmatimonadota bacterium]